MHHHRSQSQHVGNGRQCRYRKFVTTKEVEDTGTDTLQMDI